MLFRLARSNQDRAEEVVDLEVETVAVVLMEALVARLGVVVALVLVGVDCQPAG